MCFTNKETNLIKGQLQIFNFQFFCPINGPESDQWFRKLRGTWGGRKYPKNPLGALGAQGALGSGLLLEIGGALGHSGTFPFNFR